MSNKTRHTSETSTEVPFYDDTHIHHTAKTLVISSVVYNLYLLFVPACLCFLLVLPFIILWYSGIFEDTVYFFDREGAIIPVLLWVLIVLLVVVYFFVFLNRRNNLYIILGVINMGKALCTIPIHVCCYLGSLWNKEKCRKFIIGVMPPGVKDISVIGIVRAFINANSLQKSESQVFSAYAKVRQTEEKELAAHVAELYGYASFLNGGSPLCKKAFLHGVRPLDASGIKVLTACFNNGISDSVDADDLLKKIGTLVPDELFRRRDLLNTLVIIVYATQSINDKTLDLIERFGEVLSLPKEDINYALKYYAGGRYQVSARKKAKSGIRQDRRAEGNAAADNLFSDMKSESVRKYINREADLLLMSLLGYIIGSFGELDEEKHELLMRMLDSVGMPADEQYIKAFEAGASVKYAPYEDIEKFREKYQEEDPDEIKLLLLKLIRMMHVDGDISERERLIFSQIGLGFGFHDAQTRSMIAKEKNRIDAIEAGQRLSDSES